MIDKQKLQKFINDPILAARMLNILYYSRLNTRQFNPTGVNFFEFDWDNLIILDACRADTFTTVIDQFELSGTTESRESLGTATPEFLQANLRDRDLSDTVYVTATSMLYRETSIYNNIRPTFHDIIDVWETKIKYGKGGVPPAPVTDAGINAIQEYPSKRLVVHYIQPHTPFIGEFGQEQFGEGEHAIWDDKFCGHCDISDEVIRKAYEENLRVVMIEVERLVEELSGKTVITSDHGQAIGDRASPIPVLEYGHPSGLYIDALTQVPWFTCEYDERRRITRGRKKFNYEKSEAKKDSMVRNQLEGLGYI